MFFFNFSQLRSVPLILFWFSVFLPIIILFSFIFLSRHSHPSLSLLSINLLEIEERYFTILFFLQEFQFLVYILTGQPLFFIIHLRIAFLINLRNLNLQVYLSQFYQFPLATFFSYIYLLPHRSPSAIFTFRYNHI